MKHGSEQKRVAQNDNCGLGNLLMSEKSCFVGIRLVNSLFYTAAASDWSHKYIEREARFGRQTKEWKVILPKVVFLQNVT